MTGFAAAGPPSDVHLTLVGLAVTGVVDDPEGTRLGGAAQGS
jgi:hypothetical protein